MGVDEWPFICVFHWRVDIAGPLYVPLALNYSTRVSRWHNKQPRRGYHSSLQTHTWCYCINFSFTLSSHRKSALFVFISSFAKKKTVFCLSWFLLLQKRQFFCLYFFFFAKKKTIFLSLFLLLQKRPFFTFTSTAAKNIFLFIDFLSKRQIICFYNFSQKEDFSKFFFSWTNIEIKFMFLMFNYNKSTFFFAENN